MAAEVQSAAGERVRADARVAGLGSGRRIGTESEETVEGAALPAELDLVGEVPLTQWQVAPPDQDARVDARALRRDHRERLLLARVVEPAKRRGPLNDRVPGEAGRDDRDRRAVRVAHEEEHGQDAPGISLVGEGRVHRQGYELPRQFSRAYAGIAVRCGRVGRPGEEHGTDDQRREPMHPLSSLRPPGGAMSSSGNVQSGAILACDFPRDA